MRKFLLAFAVAGLITNITLAGNENKDKSATYKVNTTTSTVQWIGKKLTGEHNGVINMTQGNLEITNNKVTGGIFEFDMSSIECRDLTGEYKTKLENHLKSDDFFDAEKFPTSRFAVVSVVPVKGAKKGSATHTVSGNMTIKGITHPISFPAIIKVEGDKVNSTGEITIDRSKFDVRYRSKTFFADIGDKMIYDDFIIKVNIAATK
jgi:polyisoprenoid-binding protein YceI